MVISSAAAQDLARAPRRPKTTLLLFFTTADNPQRDAVCATLAWLAAAEGSLFECYFDSAHAGIHFGGGHPGWFDPADLRGSMVTGGRHVEAFQVLLNHFDCHAVILGSTLFEGPIRDAGIPVRSHSAHLDKFYREIFDSSPVERPDTLLVVGDGGRPQGIPLGPYAYPEIVNRRLLTVADSEPIPHVVQADGAKLQSLWLPARRVARWREIYPNLVEIDSPPTGSRVVEQTTWMARRWSETTNQFLIGDPELVARWTPSAVRYGWTPIYGIPQSEAIDRMSEDIAQTRIAYGRQHHDQDFFKLSKLGVGFQVIDPGSPPFPVIREVRTELPAPPPDAEEPSDDQLLEWSEEGRVLSSILFWSGMIRELQNLYALADLLSLTGLRAGLVLTSESFRYMSGSPLMLVNVPRQQGGLFPRIEVLLTDTGSGVLVAADAPPSKFACTLKASVDELRRCLGPGVAPRGWWAHMDAPIVPGPNPRMSLFVDKPRVRLRYKPRDLEFGEPPPPPPQTNASRRTDVRALLKASPLRRYLAPLRPYEAWRPGLPATLVLEAVRDSGFEYAVTKAGFGPTPRVFDGIDGLTVINHTAGRWDGWSPFHTVNSIGDLRAAERSLLQTRRPGWLLGAIDTCLWTFTAPLWSRGRDLHEIAAWLAAGGSRGRLVNVTPRTVARYARLLSATGRVDRISAG